MSPSGGMSSSYLQESLEKLVWQIRRHECFGADSRKDVVQGLGNDAWTQDLGTRQRNENRPCTSTCWKAVIRTAFGADGLIEGNEYSAKCWQPRKAADLDREPAEHAQHLRPCFLSASRRTEGDSQACCKMLRWRRTDQGLRAHSWRLNRAEVPDSRAETKAPDVSNESHPPYGKGNPF